MQLNASHVAAWEGPSILKTAPEGRPGEQSMLEALPRWGGRQWQHQVELSRKGVGAHHKVLLMGEGMHGRHPRPSPQWAL